MLSAGGARGSVCTACAKLLARTSTAAWLRRLDQLLPVLQPRCMLGYYPEPPGSLSRCTATLSAIYKDSHSLVERPAAHCCGVAAVRVPKRQCTALRNRLCFEELNSRRLARHRSSNPGLHEGRPELAGSLPRNVNRGCCGLTARMFLARTLDFFGIRLRHKAVGHDRSSCH